MTENTPNRTILITGANGGLGSAVALACAAQGAQLVLMDLKSRPLERLCDQVEALGAPAPGYCEMDLARVGPEAVEELVGGLVEAYGGIDGLVHCAARFEGLRPFDQVIPADWLLDLQVNLNAAWLVTRACLPSLRQRSGTVVFFEDREAVGKAYWGGYGVAKAATAALADMLAEELECGPCKVLKIAPGPMRTALRAAAYLAEDPNTVPDPAVVADQVARALLG
jgi:NAD(P)-dependent dehydrogenase (short-subunit alcohol dehydrogenase family)